jgi:transmembrane sensor
MDLDARLARGPLRVRSVWSEDRPERVARQVLRRNRLLFALDVFLVCGSAALFVWVRGVGSPAAPLSAAPMVAAAGVPTETFRDGSVAELLGRDTNVRVERDTPQHLVTRLTGGARFRVVRDPQRTFEVQAGDVRVRVLGTTFSVVQLPSGPTQVFVEEGHVKVDWLGGSAELQGGEGGVFPPSERNEVRAAAAVPSPAPQESAQPAMVVAAAVGSPGARASTAKGWREYAAKGDFAQAYEELNSSSRDAVRDEAADLMLAADVARLSGHPEQAVSPLRKLCERHAGDRRAPVAAFTLGRVLVDDLGRPADAAAAFEKARVLWPSGPLAEDALAREADAWQRAGRRELARAIAEQYLARYPQGRHASSLQRVLTP